MRRQVVVARPIVCAPCVRARDSITSESERNLRNALATAEAAAPCVLWIDEIEKGFAGSKSGGSSDGGTSSRVFGSFLSWMQEKEKSVFVVATANDVSQLPPEFLRKGRFDEMFFVDLPDAAERAQIWEIVIRRHGRKTDDFDSVALANASEEFTGAEIDAVFVDALYDAFLEGREPTDLDMVNSMTRMVPLAKLMDRQIAALKQWAKGRAREAAGERATAKLPTRRISTLN